MNIDILLRALYAAILLIVSYTDLRWRRIPNRIIYPAIVITLAVIFLEQTWQSALIGALIGAVMLLIPILVYGPQRAGIGDVKLALFIGLILGFPAIVYVLVIASVAAGIFAFGGLALHRISRHTTFPFAPFLAFGTIVLLLC